MKFLCCIIISLCVYGHCAAQDGWLKLSHTPTFFLYNVNTEKRITITEKRDAKVLSLFIFLSPECPLCQNYTPLLNTLQSQYNSKIIEYGIVPGKSYTPNDVRTFARQYKIAFTLLIDSTKQFTNHLKAGVTPEVVLLGYNNELLYKGAIDDLLQHLGKQRIMATKHYLQDAIEASLGNKPVPVKQTTAVGCRINDQ